MPLLSILRFLFTLLSLVVLVAAGYLIWRWLDGMPLEDAEGNVRRFRDTSWLLAGLLLLALSFGGRFFWVLLLARPDQGQRSSAARRDASTVVTPEGQDLYVEQSGKVGGPTVVLVHGWGLDSTIWHLPRQQLEQSFSVVTFDLPGLGRSRLHSRIDFDQFAASLKAVADLQEAPVVLVGHSIGGMIIQHAMRRYPEWFGGKVRGAVLVNTTYTNPLKTMVASTLLRPLQPIIELFCHLQIWLWPLAWLSAWQSYLSGSTHLAMRFGFGSRVTHSQLDHAALLTTRNPPAAQAKGNLAMFHWKAQGAVHTSPVPILVIGGDLDIVTMPEASRDLAAASGGRLVIVPEANHMAFLEGRDVVVPEIERFVASLAAGAGSA